MITYRKDDCVHDNVQKRRLFEGFTFGNGSISYFGRDGSITVVSTIIGNAGKSRIILR